LVRWFVVDHAKAQKARKMTDGLPMLLRCLLIWPSELVVMGAAVAGVMLLLGSVGPDQNGQIADLHCQPHCDMRLLFVSRVTSLSLRALLVDCGTIGLEIADTGRL
jgi:hypothetical protein